MATRYRTKVTLLVILNIIVKTQCDNDIVRPTKYAMPIAEEPLLRSSDDRPERIIDDIAPPTIPDEEEVENALHITTAAPVFTENNYDQTDAVFTTASNTETIQDIPEALGLTNDETNLTEDLPENDRGNESIDVTTAVNYETAMATEVAVEKDDVDKQIDTVDANIEEETDDSIKTEATPTISSPPPSPATTTPAEDSPTLGPRVTRFEEDRDAGQRSPKTEHSDPVIETRSFDVTKPRSSPQASQSATLRSWLEDPWLRAPPGLLVPLRPGALRRALAVWGDAAGTGLNVSDIVVIGYDANGVNWRSKHNLRHSSSDKAVTEVLSKLLRKYQDVRTNDIPSDGTMQALTLSSKLVPFDSALFIITDRGPADPQRGPLAVRALVEKRLKVYTIWTDPEYPSEESERSLQELRNISAHTEGDVLPYSLEVMDLDGMGEGKQLDVLEPQARMAKLNSLTDEKMETLLVKRGGGGAISLGVPVEAGVSALRIYIEGAVEHAVLYPPNDAPQIDLYNQTSVALYSRGSRTDGLSPRDVYLAFTGDDSLSVLPVSTRSPATAGVWHFSMRCDTCDYRLTIGATASIHFTTSLLDGDGIRLRVVGPVSTVRDSALVDEYGAELSKLTFSYQPAAGEGEHPRPGQQDQELVAEVPLPRVKASRVYAKIVGRDVHAGEGEHPRPGQQDQELVAEVPLPAVKASRVYAKIVGRDVHAGEGEHPRPGQQDQELVAEVPLPAVKAPRVYAKIVGRDVHGRFLQAALQCFTSSCP
ncbi:hypothetical protein JYU34_007979 [Plutella xylostella]|uniref:VWFA domain-containing protein n=1 Tax=Plutella xylostella TaxID=51655 RepID=A0ABQ7QNI5_PLUXY|nr:hypothetical protein JYU34_007979 [Plutella xylostella]